MPKVNDRIELIHTTDRHTQLKPGDQGTVRYIDSLDTVHVRWDSGSSLGMVPGEDSFRVVKED